MFFEDKDQIWEIAKKCGTSIFVLPPKLELDFNDALVLRPETKSVISIDQVRQAISKTNLKQTKDQFIVIFPAEALAEEAANALLKNLEEPGEKLHFVLITAMPSAILPTILSRAEIFVLKDTNSFGKIDVDDDTKALAKKLLVARGSDLVNLAEQISKHKEKVREYALSVVGTAIQMLYQSYFLTSKLIFLQKLPKFLQLYDDLLLNGHIKLQIVADLC